MEVSHADNQTLRRIVRDLAAITLLPSIRSGYTPQAIAEGLSDVLLTILNLDLVYVCLKGKAGAIEVARTRTQLCPPSQVTTIGRALDNWQEMNGATSVRSVSSPLGQGKLRIATLPIGYVGPQNRVIIGTKAETLEETDLLLFKA